MQLGFVDVLLFGGGFKIKVKYYGGQTEFISQKSIGKTIAQKHSLKSKIKKSFIFLKVISVHFS